MEICRCLAHKGDPSRCIALHPFLSDLLSPYPRIPLIPLYSYTNSYTLIPVYHDARIALHPIVIAQQPPLNPQLPNVASSLA